ncbi:SPFH domain-containing protein [Saccharopolyspora sp. HNM0983]|uniref:SPFH domain-containing protein n=1 Tax=Saccharopolyspora montiporae TaxID=2781240 RepID=A0A929B744_9PSEU|nr:SPFH domain-containing protein [Saccharopolyspora sp. HNM0983]MBE9373045.1 SPFH domain-containing protein [Saccharopolyspora sp. HNM0983]
MTTNPPEHPETEPTRERTIRAVGGFGMIGVVLAVAAIAVALFLVAVANQPVGAPGAAMIAVAVLLILADLVLCAGFTAVAPGEARVVQLLGRYVGTLRADGLQWVNPITTRRKVSTRVRNHETETSKVNDADGNPIEIAAVVVWQVADTAQAVFEVDDFEEFVSIQAETAVRHIANSYPYDAHGQQRPSLRDSADEIADRLSHEVTERVAPAGVRIVESRITHLAYAPEIASAMLRRQQADAVVSARQRIVEGAVGMVETALTRLEQDEMVELDEERKAAMISNLLVVLVGDRDAQPVVNTGSLYQ